MREVRFRRAARRALPADSLLKRDWKAGPPGDKDLRQTFVLMENARPQFSLGDISHYKVESLLSLFEV